MERNSNNGEQQQEEEEGEARERKVRVCFVRFVSISEPKTTCGPFLHDESWSCRTQFWGDYQAHGKLSRGVVWQLLWVYT